MLLTPHQVLKKYWGYDDFRPLQLDIVQSAIDGQDTLALLPTGGGKSICFQVPALCMDGVCVVISPLIALMKDQVKNLQKIGVNAQAIYSGLKYKDIDRILDNCVHGSIKFLYISPERLQTEILLERLKKMNVCLLAIDEAHCISQWGYDFRPSYLKIAEIRPLLPKVPILALTATATAPVVQDIQDKLDFKPKSQVFQKSFGRDNLAYVVLYEENKKVKLLDILNKVKGSGVVYVMNRRLTKEIAYYLNQHQISADYYHAGRPNTERERIQEDWINDKIRIMVATNAFGMGIDKPDVRVVVHLTLPDNLEAYFQEAGRGGRDGKKAFATLIYNQTDKIKLEQQYQQAFPPIPLIKRVYQALGSYYQLAVGGGQWQTFDFDLVNFCKTYNFKPIETLNALKILMQEAYIDLSDNVFIPSTLQILLKKENLYDYLLKSPKMEKLIKVILRSFQGAFNYPVNIREGQLAKFLHIRREILVEMLTKLHKDGIIAYKAQTDSPQLTFLLERLPMESVGINQEHYNFLKNRHLFRMNKAIYYAETLQCRSQLLLDYFDEKGAKKCGQCDVCLGRHEKYVQHKAYFAIKRKVEYLLKQQPLALRPLVDSFESSQQEKVLQTIEHLLDNQIIWRDNSLLLRWNGG